MFARALIVVLVALNLGVAAWWLLRPAPPAPLPPVSDQGGAELRVLPMPAPAAQAAAAKAGEPRGGGPADAVAAAVALDGAGEGIATAEAGAEAGACLRLGPFPDRDAAQVAQSGLGALLREASFQEEAANATGYRVLLPPLADLGQAQATADRIAAAGFQDFLVLRQGQEANAIALGSYRSRETAESRATALRTAGFPAEIRAQGASGGSRWWLDAATTDAGAVRAAFPGAQDRDCAPR